MSNQPADPSSFFNPYQRQADAIRNRQRSAAPGPARTRSSEFQATAQDLGPEPTNAMEMLVTLEVVHQVQALPQPLQDFIKISQVKAYALNILPPLYVTSAEGWERQWERGKHELYDKVKLAVRQGIAAVRRDPLRETTALPHDRTPVADSVLKQIQQLLGDDSLTWYNVVPALKRSLRQRPAEPSVAPARASALIPPGSQARSSPAQPPQAKPSPAQAQADPGRSGEFDWDAHPLHQRGW